MIYLALFIVLCLALPRIMGGLIIGGMTAVVILIRLAFWFVLAAVAAVIVGTARVS